MCPEHVSSDDCHRKEFRISAEAYRALGLLVYAYASAQDAGGPIAEFALGIDELHEVAIKSSDLRWLIRKGYVRHFVELRIPGQPGRVLHPTDSVDFQEASCFMLTDEGVLYARHVLADPVKSAETTQVTSHDSQPTGEVIPNYDAALRELTFDGHMLRRYRFEAPTQELILTEFQQRNWPHRINDPLERLPGTNPKIRLNKSVNRLNAGFIRRLSASAAAVLDGVCIGYRNLTRCRSIYQDKPCNQPFSPPIRHVLTAAATSTIESA